MELFEKLQALRKQKGITQKELADAIFVSRTAVSKWEAGRGYPSIDSLKAIAAFYGVTVDALLSPSEVLAIAEGAQRETRMHFADLSCGLLDLCALLFFFLPLFAMREGGAATAVSLLSLRGASVFLTVLYYAFVCATAVLGAFTLALQNCENRLWIYLKSKLSFAFSLASVLLFILGLHPYAAVLGFSLLFVKALVFLKKR